MAKASRKRSSATAAKTTAKTNAGKSAGKTSATKTAGKTTGKTVGKSTVSKTARKAAGPAKSVKLSTGRLRRLPGDAIPSPTTARAFGGESPVEQVVRTRAHNRAGHHAVKQAPTKHRTPRLIAIEPPQKARLDQIAEIVTRASSLTLHEGKDRVVLSGATLGLFKEFVAALKEGPLSLLVGSDTETELTSQEAADLLNVSRPFVTKLADEEVLPVARMAGNRRKFLLADVLAYDAQARASREEALSAMAPEGGYSAEDF